NGGASMRRLTSILIALSFGCGMFTTAAAKPARLYPGYREVTLTSFEIGCVDRVLKEMNKRGLSYTGLQMVIRNAGDFYSVLFINPGPRENDTAIGWHVRKSDLSVEGPIFQK